MVSLGGIIRNKAGSQQEGEEESSSSAAKKELKKAKDILTGGIEKKPGETYKDAAEKAQDVLTGDVGDTEKNDNDGQSTNSSNEKQVSNRQPEKTQNSEASSSGNSELQQFRQAAGLAKPDGKIDSSNIADNNLDKLAAKKALGRDITEETRSGPVVPQQVEYSNTDAARMAVYSSVRQSPEIADYARTLRTGSESREKFVKNVIRNDPSVSLDSVQRFNDIISKNNLQNNNLNVLVGSAQASAASERFTERFKNNPVSDSVGRLFAGIGAAGNEATDVLTGQGFNRTDAEESATLQARNEISSFVTSAGAETVALPGTLQAWSGEVSRLVSGDESAGNAAGEIIQGFDASADQAVESFKQQPYVTGVKAGLTAATAATGYYGGTYLRTGSTPDLDLDAGTLARKAKSKSREVSNNLKVSGEPVKSTDYLRSDPASIEDGKPVTPTGKEVDTRKRPAGSSSNAFPTDLRKKTSVTDLAMGRGPKNTEKLTGQVKVAGSKIRDTVADGKNIKPVFTRKGPEGVVSVGEFEDVRVTGTKSGLEALTDPNVDVRARNGQDVSELVDVADDSGSSGRSRKGQIAVSRKKTKSEEADTTGRSIDAQDRRQDVASDMPEYYDTSLDSRSRTDTEFNKPGQVPGEVTAAGLVVPSDLDNPAAGSQLNLSVNTEQKTRNESVTEQESRAGQGSELGLELEAEPFEAQRKKRRVRTRLGTDGEGVSGRGREEGRRNRRDRDLDFGLGSENGRKTSLSGKEEERRRRRSASLGIDALSAIQSQESAGETVSFVGGQKGLEMQTGATATLAGFPTVEMLKQSDGNGSNVNGRGDFI